MNNKFLPAIVIFSILASCQIFAAATLYTVKLERPSKKGETYTITIEARDYQAITMTDRRDGSIIKNNSGETHLKLESDVAVLEVSPGGDPISLNYTVIKFVDLSAKESPAILPKGTVINARLDKGKTVFGINGKPVADDFKEILKLVINMSPGDNENDDSIVGTDKKVAVGERWKINAAKAADLLRSDTVKIDDKDVAGYASIQETLKKGGLDCLKVAVEITIARLIFPLPESVKISDSTAQINIYNVVPVDVSKGIQEQSMKMVLQLKGQGKLNDAHPDISLDVEMGLSKNIEYRY